MIPKQVNQTESWLWFQVNQVLEKLIGIPEMICSPQDLGKTLNDIVQNHSR